MVLISFLEKTVSSDKGEREAAQNYLKQTAQNNRPEYLKSLSDVLQNIKNPPVARMAAGLQLKNALRPKWRELPLWVKDYIKQNVLSALGTETIRPSSAAQCVAYIAVAELPWREWPDIIMRLKHNVTNAASTEKTKEATLETISYICQHIDREEFVSYSKDILTAIVHGMRKDEPSDNVKLAGTNALLNSLKLIKANFEIESERHFIMQVVCEATQSSDTKVRVAALQCLVKIMSLYYQYMETYMGQALFAITKEAMKSDIDEVALQGIEFWSNVCDEELEIKIETAGAAKEGIPPDAISRFYAKGALQYLVPILMQTLTKQEEHDDWSPCKAAGVCLTHMAECCEDDIVPHVLPFVKDNIENMDWRYRDAAVMAFGCILEGPDPNNLKPIVEQAMPMLIKLMSDENVIVRNTVVWTTGRVCEFIPEAAVNKNYSKPLLEALINGLSAEPNVAYIVCCTFSRLAKAAFKAAKVLEENQEPSTYCLSEYFGIIVAKLLETAERPDSNQANLRSAAYEALMKLVKNSPRDCYVWVQKTTESILERLNHFLALELDCKQYNYNLSFSEKMQYRNLQSLLCATLQSVLRKMTPDDASKISDAIMHALLQMFDSSGCMLAGFLEDGLMTVSVLAKVLGEQFLKYMDVISPYLANGLKSIDEYEVCSAAFDLTGDICRALSIKVLPYCDNIMTLLMENLSNTELHRFLKPQILSVFGDIALAIGPHFQKYLDIVIQTLLQASQTQAEKDDSDMINYVNELREGCLKAYTGIIQGFKGDQNTPNSEVNVVQPHVPYIVQFITHIAQDPDHSDGTVAASAGVIGDLCLAFGQSMLALVDNDIISGLLIKGRRSEVAKTKIKATWAFKEMWKLKNAA